MFRDEHVFVSKNGQVTDEFEENPDFNKRLGPRRNNQERRVIVKDIQYLVGIYGKNCIAVVKPKTFDNEALARQYAHELARANNRKKYTYIGLWGRHRSVRL